MPKRAQQNTEGAYTVFVDDNGRYMDKDARYEAGRFESYEQAVAECKQIVDRCLAQYGATAEGLAAYRQFGEDPFIVGPQGDRGHFSAWGYAEARCKGGG